MFNAEINRKLDLIIRLLCRLLNEEYLTVKTIEDLTTDVEAQTTLTTAVQTTISGLAEQIAALKTTQTDPTTAAKIDALAQKVEANNAAFQAAIPANTPAATPAQ